MVFLILIIIVILFIAVTPLMSLSSSPGSSASLNEDGDSFSVSLNGYHISDLRRYLNNGSVVNVWRNRDDQPQVRIYIRDVAYLPGSGIISVFRDKTIYDWAKYRSEDGYKHHYELYNVTRHSAEVRRVESVIKNYKSISERRQIAIQQLKKKPKFRFLTEKFVATLNRKIGPNRDNAFLSIGLEDGVTTQLMIHQHYDEVEEADKYSKEQFDNDFQEKGEVSADDIVTTKHKGAALYYKAEKCNQSPLSFDKEDRFIRMLEHYQVESIMVLDRWDVTDDGMTVQFLLTFSKE